MMWYVCDGLCVCFVCDGGVVWYVCDGLCLGFI